ncbi:MAG: helix-turn-helix transcriptional regulator [Deltaproteobacteria bacterium]|nr:helix-turn-helix transcriptional regulator [Deltaproteobacteria bacterium]MBW1923460.1 helix-turn-helix transcriptional regulator [Deltaproteobacteria bacterium]MBW1949619.1 helix-turn-helix transcriptional regulator [Deltaproteobacteria bacterium]MBW2007811.1 helix-turn-helix transcriptional regulator [Deltaproteobacteria bacterium]MBW2347270.1 helix-turn-helix transcriptional regulator [Deltaproteobacteria bacterium]
MAARKKSQPIGKRLFKLRKDRGMTLKNLANETGLASRYISQVEKGEVIPPVSVILQLSRALEVDSSILLQEEKARAKKKSRDDYQKRTEDYTYETLTPESRHKHLKAFKIFIDPKAEHKGVSYQHLGEEFQYVLKGKVEVMVGENRNVLGPGECLHFNSSIVHRLRNVSSERAELLVVLYTP